MHLKRISLVKGYLVPEKSDMTGRDFHLIGIGLAEGGVEPLLTILLSLPAELNGAFFILNHLPPGLPSFTGQLLRLYTKIPVHEAQNGMKIQPGHLYFLPVNYYMTLTGGLLSLQMREPKPKSNQAIDRFLSSLAADAGWRAVGILLSGNGNDGVIGLAHVMQAGGIAIVQRPETAEHPEIPGRAAEAGFANFKLDPVGIAGLLIELVKSL